jgi:hypothetical protein
MSDRLKSNPTERDHVLMLYAQYQEAVISSYCENCLHQSCATRPNIYRAHMFKNMGKGWFLGSNGNNSIERKLQAWFGLDCTDLSSF